MSDPNNFPPRGRAFQMMKSAILRDGANSIYFANEGTQQRNMNYQIQENYSTQRLDPQKAFAPCYMLLESMCNAKRKMDANDRRGALQELVLAENVINDNFVGYYEVQNIVPSGIRSLASAISENDASLFNQVMNHTVKELLTLNELPFNQALARVKAR